eukprot:ANDGO_02695.mRNA.1 hypothetical protein
MTLVVVDVAKAKNAEALLVAAHEMVSATFVREDVEPYAFWESSVLYPLPSESRKVSVNLFVGIEAADGRVADGEVVGEIVSLCHLEYYHESRCCMFVYWAVLPRLRSGGIGKLTWEQSVQQLRQKYPLLRVIFAECHDAQITVDPLMVPVKRQEKFFQLGFRFIPVQYYLPSLHDDAEPPAGYVLVAKIISSSTAEELDAAQNHGILEMFYHDLLTYGLSYAGDRVWEPLALNMQQVKSLREHSPHSWLRLQQRPPWTMLPSLENVDTSNS